MPPPALRVLMTADAVGGVWTYALDVARALRARDVAVTLAVLGPAPDPGQVAAARAVPGLALLQTGLPLDWLAEDERNVARAATAVADLARGIRADVTHLNSPALAGFAAWPTPVVGVCHSCELTWSVAVRGVPPDADRLWRTRRLGRGYAACDALVAPSASFAAATRRHYRRLPAVIHNGRWPATTFGPSGARDRFVLTAGRLWDDGKNVAALDVAAGLIDAPVLAAGPLAGPFGDAASGARTLRHARALGSLTGADTQRWMARAPIFASAALYEPFGLAVLEAAQAGCALVLSDIGSFRELWDGAALFVPANRPALLAAALQRLLDSPELASNFGSAAQHHARRYSVQAMADATHALYHRVLMDRRSPRPVLSA